MHTLKSVLVLGSCLAGLSACTLQDIYGPSSIPRGYAHLHKEYKTVIPDRPYFIGESYSEMDVAESEALWTQSINELLNELEANAAMNGLSVFVHPMHPDNSFDVRMDYYLRQGLKDRGYFISNEPLDNAPVLMYSSRLPGYQDGLQRKGRVIDNIDDIQNEFDVQEDPHNDGKPYVFLGLGIYDLSMPKEEQELVFVETLQNLHEKDMHEIRGAVINPPIAAGIKPSSNYLK